MRSLAVTGHFDLLILPFQHALAHVDPHTLDSEWRPWWWRLSDQSAGNGGWSPLHYALDHTVYVQPHLRRVLYPETARLPGDGDADFALARTWRDALPSQWVPALRRDQPLEPVVRLTWTPLGREHGGRRLTLTQHAEGEPRHFRAELSLRWVDIVLFPHGLGLLVLKVRNADPVATHDSMVQIQRRLRVARPLERRAPAPLWQLDLDGEQPQTAAALVQRLTRPLASPLPWPAFRESNGVYFQMLTYAAITDLAPAEAPPAFEDAMEAALYEVATGTQVDEPGNRHDVRQVRKAFDNHGLRLWENWSGLALREHVVFLARGREAGGGLKHNVEGPYLMLYLTALFQRLRLNRVFDEMVSGEADARRNAREAHLCWRRFIDFRNRFWFPELSARPQAGELWRRFQEALGVNALFDQVIEEARDLKDFHHDRAERRTQALLNFLTFFAVPIGLLSTFFANALVKDATWPQFFRWGLGCGVVSLVVWVWWNRRREP